MRIQFTALAAVALLYGLSSQNISAASLSPLEIYGSISIGGLLSGEQKDFPDSYLAPTPDSYSAFQGFFGIRLFIFEQAGMETFLGLGGKTHAESKQVSSSLALYEFSTANFGPVLRYNFSPGPDGWLSLLLGGGVSYSFPHFAFDFWNLVWSTGGGGRSMSSDFGWYAKAGVAWYPSRHLFFDLTAHYANLNAKEYTSGPFNGVYLLVAVSIGVTLF